MMELKDRIIFARERSGMKQHQIADRLGLTQQAIQSWERGKSSPRLQKMRKLAEVLNVSEEWLSTGNGSFKMPVKSSANEEQIDSEIISIIDQLEGEEKNDAINILQAMLSKRKILNKYGID